jgi:hypothetical protein
MIADHQPLSVAAPVLLWKQIDILAAQIETPCVEYTTDPLTMAQAVIKAQCERANMLRRLIPAEAQDNFGRP